MEAAIGIFDYDKTAGNNLIVEGISRAEGMGPANVNNGMRADTAALAKWRDDQGGQLTTTGGANAYSLTTNSVVPALADGVRVTAVANHTNSGAATLNVDSLGGKAIRKVTSISTDDTALEADDIRANQVCDFVYDASANSAAGAWILLLPASASAPMADQTEAETGAINTKRMSPLRVAQHVNERERATLTKRVATKAALTALLVADLDDAQLVRTAGYAAAGGDGGAVYYWDAASTATADGVIIHQLDAGGTGRFRLVNLLTLDPRVAGVKFSGSDADAATNLTAWTLIVAAINAGTVKHVQCPAGTFYISGSPNEITGSDWTIAAAPSGTTMIMAATAGTAGRFFKLGNSGTAAERAVISGFTLSCANSTSLTGSVAENCFVLSRAQDVTIQDIALTTSNTVNGLCTLGSSADATNCNKVYFINVRGLVRGGANSTAIDIQLSSGHTFAHVALATSASVATSHIGLHIHPLNGDVIDGGTFLDFDLNYVTTNKPDNAIIIDATQGIITNQVFTDIVADHVNVAGVTLKIGATPAATARMNNIRFNNCRTTGDGTEGGGARPGKGLVLDNTGNKPMRSLQWIGGLIQSYESNCVDKQSNNDIDMLIEGVGLIDTGGGTARAAVTHAGGAGLRVQDCYAHHINSTCAFNYGFTFTGNASGSRITDNDFRAVTIADVNSESIGAANLQFHEIRGNRAPNLNALGRTATADATATTLANIALNDARVYHVRVLVWGVQDGGSARGTHELAGTFYRTGGGAATPEGAVTTIHTAGLGAATLDANGNNVRVRVTGAAATIDWGCHILEVKSFAE